MLCVHPGAAHAVTLLVDGGRDAAPGGGEVPGRTQAGRPRPHHAHSLLNHVREGARRDLLKTNLGPIKPDKREHVLVKRLANYPRFKLFGLDSP